MVSFTPKDRLLDLIDPGDRGENGIDLGDIISVTLPGASVSLPLADALGNTVQADALRETVISKGKNTAELQRVIDLAADNALSANISNANWSLNTPIVTGTKAVKVTGQGAVQTRLIGGNKATDIWQHGIGTMAAAGAVLEISDVGFSAAGASGSRYAINAFFDRNTGALSLENVRFGGFGAGLAFDRYGMLRGASNTSFKKVRAFGSVYDTPANRLLGTQIGFEITSNDNNDKSYVYLFDDIIVEAEKHAFLFNILGFPGNSGSIEGVIMNKAYGRTNIGHWLKEYEPNSQDVWFPPFWSFTDSNYQGCGGWLSFDGASAIYIDKSFIYCDGARPTVGTGDGLTPALNTLEFKNSKRISIDRLELNLLPDCKLDYGLYFEDCDDVFIENLVINYPTTGAPLALTGGVYIAPDCTNVKIGNVTFSANWPSNKPKITDGTNNFNPLEVLPSQTGQRLTVRPYGDGVNIPVVVEARGFAEVALRSNGLDVLRAVGNTGSVNGVKVTSSGTGSPPMIEPADAAETNTAITLKGKGTQGVILRSGDNTRRIDTNNTGVGFNGTLAIAKPALAAAATDAASTQTLVNSIRTALINYGLTT